MESENDPEIQDRGEQRFERIYGVKADNDAYRNAPSIYSEKHPNAEVRTAFSAGMTCGSNLRLIAWNRSAFQCGKLLAPEHIWRCALLKGHVHDCARREPSLSDVPCLNCIAEECYAEHGTGCKEQGCDNCDRNPIPTPCGEPINEGPSWGYILAPIAVFLIIVFLTRRS